jgi:hypothetical protein
MLAMRQSEPEGDACSRPRKERRDIKGPSGADRVTAARKVGCIANRRAVGSAARVAHEFSRRLTAVIRRLFPLKLLRLRGDGMDFLSQPFPLRSELPP